MNRFFLRVKGAILGLIGVNETLFLLGMAGIFAGICQKWTLYDALIVCGALLVAVSIFSIVLPIKAGK